MIESNQSMHRMEMISATAAVHSIVPDIFQNQAKKGTQQ